ncbi:ribosomal protein S21 [Ceratobasidium sp. AG-Ba]|nr:ribosomal protein S21 [Ceratobasidium sp. AG-Ba]
MLTLFRTINRPLILPRALKVYLNPARGVSKQVGFDKYFAPYPTLPNVTSLKQTQAQTNPSAPEESDSIFKDLTFSTEVRALTPDERWASVHELALRDLHDPGNVYTGRSVAVPERGHDLSSAYRRLHVILSRNRVRSELFLQKRYEKPSDRERRLKSERHRRRFAAWIRKKVQLVSEIRRRG